MKHNMLLLLAGAALLIIQSGCVSDKCNNTITYARFSPVYMTETEFEQAVQVEPARVISQAGKIYLKDSYLFVNEVAQGVHIIDNKDPQNPQALSFLRVPGNYDIAVHCGYLYLDSSKDLLVFDLADPANPTLVSRVTNTLPHITQYRGYSADPAKGVVVGWIQEFITAEIGCDETVPAAWLANEVQTGSFSPNDNGRTINPATPGKAGSMSRFAVSDNNLYVVTESEIRVFDATSCTQPVATATVSTSRGGAETIFLGDKNRVLVGTSTGMLIYEENAIGGLQLKGEYSHMTSCDPVVSDGDLAYVTLRNGDDNPCGDGFANQLDVVDISNPQWPQLIASFPMTNPHGLAVDGDKLFLADGRDGLKAFDNVNPQRVGSRLLARATDKFGYDVIVDGDVVIMTGKDGIAQYRFTDNKFTLLSLIPILL